MAGDDMAAGADMAQQSEGGASKRSPPRKLVSHLPEDLIRAVPSDVALQGYGRHWKGNVTGSKDFFLSQDTEEIDDFIQRSTKVAAAAESTSPKASPRRS
eukprot:TRINITY_DN20268_c0_g1_i1.p1 TRINITY_DN20268_c0_g1~~TRINITY_DN20268_c0_g1_i1.p1  ORF type:complete len:100 (-),score=14.53 TRINITY_DN20268_c0_g1_i1:38-337(-)